MTDERKPTVKEAREQRLAAALRENLKRRKQQARGRAAGRPGPPEPEEVARPEKPRKP